MKKFKSMDFNQNLYKKQNNFISFIKKSLSVVLSLLLVLFVVPFPSANALWYKTVLRTFVNSQGYIEGINKALETLEKSISTMLSKANSDPNATLAAAKTNYNTIEEIFNKIAECNSLKVPTETTEYHSLTFPVKTSTFPVKRIIYETVKYNCYVIVKEIAEDAKCEMKKTPLMYPDSITGIEKALVKKRFAISIFQTVFKVISELTERKGQIDEVVKRLPTEKNSLSIDDTTLKAAFDAAQSVGEAVINATGAINKISDKFPFLKTKQETR